MNGDTIRKVCVTEGWTRDSCKMFKKQTQKKIGRKERNEEKAAATATTTAEAITIIIN